MSANYDRDFEECRIPLLLPMIFFICRSKWQPIDFRMYSDFIVEIYS